MIFQLVSTFSFIVNKNKRSKPVVTTVSVKRPSNGCLEAQKANAASSTPLHTKPKTLWWFGHGPEWQFNLHITTNKYNVPKSPARCHDRYMVLCCHKARWEQLPQSGLQARASLWLHKPRHSHIDRGCGEGFFKHSARNSTIPGSRPFPGDQDPTVWAQAGLSLLLPSCSTVQTAHCSPSSVLPELGLSLQLEGKRQGMGCKQSHFSCHTGDSGWNGLENTNFFLLFLLLIFISPQKNKTFA